MLTCSRTKSSRRTPALRIDSHRGLVEQQNFRPVHDAATEVEPSLHATAESLGRFAGPIGKPDQLQDFRDPILQLLATHAVGGAPIREVLGRRKVFIECELLRDDSQASSRGLLSVTTS